MGPLDRRPAAVPVRMLFWTVILGPVRVDAIRSGAQDDNKRGAQHLEVQVLLCGARHQGGQEHVCAQVSFVAGGV